MQYIHNNRVQLYNADCLDVMQHMIKRGTQVDSIVCDPPYALQSIVKRFGGDHAKPTKQGDGAFTRLQRGFLNMKWDTDIAFKANTWELARQVLKPGGYLIAFSATRNYHRLATAVEQAGFIIRDQVINLYDVQRDIASFVGSLTAEQFAAFMELLNKSDHLGQIIWNYGVGFAKTESVQKRIAKYLAKSGKTDSQLLARWQGWNNDLKPAHEPILLAQNPVSERTIVANIIKHGTGAINIDATRIGTCKRAPASIARKATGIGLNKPSLKKCTGNEPGFNTEIGRYPANVVHDNSTTINQVFDKYGITQSKRMKRGNMVCGAHAGLGHHRSRVVNDSNTERGFDDAGNVGRYFYSAKASSGEKQLGCRIKNVHPTCKPLNLMQWLCRLVTPPNGIIFDPFMGSGSTGCAAVMQDFHFIGAEKETKIPYFEIAKQRINYYSGEECSLENPQPLLQPLFMPHRFRK